MLWLCSERRLVADIFCLPTGSRNGTILHPLSGNTKGAWIWRVLLSKVSCQTGVGTGAQACGWLCCVLQNWEVSGTKDEGSTPLEHVFTFGFSTHSYFFFFLPIGFPRCRNTQLSLIRLPWQTLRAQRSCWTALWPKTTLVSLFCWRSKKSFSLTVRDLYNTMALRIPCVECLYFLCVMLQW